MLPLFSPLFSCALGGRGREKNNFLQDWVKSVLFRLILYSVRGGTEEEEEESKLAMEKQFMLKKAFLCIFRYTSVGIASESEGERI